MQPIHFQDSISENIAWEPRENRFTFLHIEHVFSEKTDWNCTIHGKLWQYNLHYFNYLLQPNLDPDEGFRCMLDFVDHLPNVPCALEPYPTSLRIIHWVKYLSRHTSTTAHSILDPSLYAQAYILADNLEYHLLGNHLLENGFALLFAAYYFQDEYLLRLAEKILIAELHEQILPDGGHFERSPMYHQTILYRVLDACNLLKNNQNTRFPQINLWAEGASEEHKFICRLGLSMESVASKMLNWIGHMHFQNGDLPRFNDTAPGIAPTAPALLDYAKRLSAEMNLWAEWEQIPLGPSGYRKFQGFRYEIITDVGDIGPDYQPGHAHCDTLSFEMYVDHQPILVNTGTSTYEKDERRQRERSTAAHNTVQITNQEQSEMWAGFRVARRAKAFIMKDEPMLLQATHTGYDHLGVHHIRKFECHEAMVRISDHISASPQRDGAGTQNTFLTPCRAYFHFHPDVAVHLKNDSLLCENLTIAFQGFSKIYLETYDFAEGFNLRRPATKAVVEFESYLESSFIVENPLPHR